MKLLGLGIAGLLLGLTACGWGVLRNSQTPMPVGPIPVVGGGVIALAGFLAIFAWLVRL